MLTNRLVGFQLSSFLFNVELREMSSKFLEVSKCGVDYLLALFAPYSYIPITMEKRSPHNVSDGAI